MLAPNSRAGGPTLPGTKHTTLRRRAPPPPTSTTRTPRSRTPGPQSPPHLPARPGTNLQRPRAAPARPHPAGPTWRPHRRRPDPNPSPLKAPTRAPISGATPAHPTRAEPTTRFPTLPALIHTHHPLARTHRRRHPTVPRVKHQPTRPAPRASSTAINPRSMAVSPGCPRTTRVAPHTKSAVTVSLPANTSRSSLCVSTSPQARMSAPPTFKGSCGTPNTQSTTPSTPHPNSSAATAFSSMSNSPATPPTRTSRQAPAEESVTSPIGQSTAARRTSPTTSGCISASPHR